MDYVVENHDPIFITRQNGEEVVLISKADYQAMDETAYLLSTEVNRKELLESIRNIESGEYKKDALVFETDEELRDFFEKICK